jgi:hypothetical protein
VFGLESAAGPTVSALKLDSQEVIGFLVFAIFYASLTVLAFEVERNNSMGRDRLFEFEARTRG